jgi:tetratricopeptide (TPR) repeat protein
MGSMPDGAGESPELTAARKFMEEGDLTAAIALLQKLLAGQPDAGTDALLALAYYRNEQYDLAVQHYENALRLSPDHPEWQELLGQSRWNLTAEVQVPVPDSYFFTREQLLARPEIAPGTLPAPPHFHPDKGLATRALVICGNVAGVLVSGVMHGATQVWGSVAGYRDRIWTNWYRRPLTLSILTLAYMRNRLNTHSLKNSYPRGTLTGFQPRGLTPPEGVTHFRTADGTWNNLANPKEGAAGTRFMRNVTNAVAHAEAGEALLTPNPRELSRKLLTRQGPMQEVPFLNLLAASWIQFMNHDWINHGEILGRDVHEIPLAEDDPARQKYWQTKMIIGKTQPDPTRSDSDETPATFINEVTHWWDASQIYGSNQETQNRLRSFAGGKLRIGADGTLPLDRKGIEETGFTRNWWIGLAMLHTLFVKEHNAICDRLALAYPHWDDNRLFNVARLINAAVIAKVHTVEWTPAILPNPVLNTALNANWYGLLTNALRMGKERKAVADVNIRNPEMGGVVGNPLDKHGAPFGLTEEFVEVYRLHSLLPDILKLRRVAGGGEAEEVPFPATRQAGSGKVASRFTQADLFYSFGNQLPGQLVLNNYPRSLQELSIPGNPLFDMGAVDILRARERGVPRYNEFRRQLGLNPIRTFDDLTDNREQVQLMKELYGGDVEKLDLMIGTLAEGHRPTGFGFGETLFQIFILNATRRLQADRFYTDSYNAEVYTPEGLTWIDESDLRTVILRHYPELGKTGLGNVTCAFEPWDTDERLDPQRHPLRGYDKALRPDPWLGNAYR